MSLTDYPLSAPESDHAAARDPSFHHYYSESQIFTAGPGTVEPSNTFERACALLANYKFSDPRIVVGHFDRRTPLLGRRMLLELRALRVIHFLCGVVVRAVVNETQASSRMFGFRYDTLVGHIETGSAWFVLTRDNNSGTITFRIQAAWKPGEFPNAWSRLGFAMVGRHYQRAWHHLAHLRMRELLGARNLHPLPNRRRLIHPLHNANVELEGETP